MDEIFKNEEDQLEIDPLLDTLEEGTLLKSLLKSAIIENRKLIKINGRLQKSVLDLRDKVALAIYAKQIDQITAELAAEDSYKLADIFLRVREGITNEIANNNTTEE